jgi:chromosomal replication initiator protein DnaA
VTTTLNPRFTFASYVAGEPNRMAHSAARSVAESPGSVYNPLVVYGASGLGKTHLLMAIGQEAQGLQPSLRVEYVTPDEFLEAYQAAMAVGQTEVFRNRFLSLHMLLLDDVQLLAKRREIQGELVRITNALQERKGQLVVASDVAPANLDGLDARLLERFNGGLVVDVGRPDFVTRLGILKSRSEERGADLSEEVLAAVAEFQVENVRELLGLLNRLAAFQAVSETPMTAAAARAVLDWEVPEEEAVLPKLAPAEAPADDPLGQTLNPVLIDLPGEDQFRPPRDEFSVFLSDVSSTVQEQVEAWREKLARTIMRWEPEGYRTARLESAYEQSQLDAPVERLIAQYEADIKRLQAAQAAIREFAPQRSKDPVFYDPDRVAEAEDLVQAAVNEFGPLPAPSSLWSDETFIEGESNQIAVSAARSVAGEPGRRYNPLVLVGPPGVGKTHLLHATGHRLVKAGLSIACLSMQQFMDELTEAERAGRVDAWRARFGRADAMLVDNLQLLAREAAPQEAFFHVFDRLFEAGRQLVVTLPGAPRDIEGLDERITSRLEGGLLAQIQEPDRELRRALIVRRLEEQYGAAELELVEYLAARPATSARAVIGLVQRVLGAAEARGVDPSGALARELIEGAALPQARTPEQIRTSGVTSPLGAVHSREKTVWQWPDPVERLIEDLA